MSNPLPLVSILIPLYNAEATLAFSLDSLLNQNYKKIELVFIDDCSSDRSVDIIKGYKEKFENQGIIVNIISHDVNQGVASARNTGLKYATGDYIYYVDADDTIEPDTIELLVERASISKADIVGCNWFLTFRKNERKMNQPSFETPEQAIEMMMRGTMRWNLWLFLVKRSLYEEYDIHFIPSMNMGEDLMVMLKLFSVAQKVFYIDEALYHYGQNNESSLTKTYSDKHREQVSTNVEEAVLYLLRSRFAEKVQLLIPLLKLNIKLPLLISDNSVDYVRWRNWFPEANTYALRNEKLSWRIRLLQWCAWKKWDLFIRIHYYVVVKFIYGIIYR